MSWTGYYWENIVGPIALAQILNVSARPVSILSSTWSGIGLRVAANPHAFVPLGSYGRFRATAAIGTASAEH